MFDAEGGGGFDIHAATVLPVASSATDGELPFERLTGTGFSQVPACATAGASAAVTAAPMTVTAIRFLIGPIMPLIPFGSAQPSERLRSSQMWSGAASLGDLRGRLGALLEQPLVDAELLD